MTLHPINVLDQTAGALAWLANLVAGLILIGMTGLILIEIAARNLLLRSTHITEEFVAFGLMSVVFLALAAALRSGGLIRVDLVVDRLGPTVRRAHEIVLSLVTLGFVVFLMKFAAATFARRWRTGAVSWSAAEVPLWIPQGIALLGMSIFCFALAVYILRLAAGAPVLMPGERIE